MRGSGGTEGGTGEFLLGFGLAVLGLYLFFDSVRASTEIHGVVSGMLRRGQGHGIWDTTSMGIIFVPFLIGVIALFYDSSMRWAWVLMWIGLAVIAIEILSRVRFRMDMKTTHLLGMMVLFGAGAGLMLRSYRDQGVSKGPDKPDKGSGQPPAESG